MKKIILYCFLLLAAPVFSQRLDSLKKEFALAKKDTLITKLRVEIAIEEGVLRIPFWDSMIIETKRFELHPAEVAANIYLGYAYFTSEKLAETKRYWQKAVELADKYSDFENGPSAFNNLAYLYEQQGAIPDAIDLYFRSLAFLEKGHDERGKGSVYNNLGSIYFDLKDMDKAYKYTQQAISIRLRLKDSASLATSLNNMGYYLQNEKQFAAALAYYDRALGIMKYQKLEGLMQNTLYNIGTILSIKGDYNAAYEKLNECYLLYKKTGNMAGQANSLSSLAEVDIKKGNMPAALSKAEEALACAKKIGYPEPIRHASKVLYEIYKTRGDKGKALEMHELFTMMKDSISKDENQKAGIQREMKYLFDNKAIADSVKNEEKIKLEQERHDQEIHQQKLYSWGGVVGALLMLLVAGVSFRAYRQKQKANTIIEEQKAMVEVKQKEIVDSINYAQRIQYALLAQDDVLKENLPDHFVLFQPKAIVSGDFYWATKKDGRFYLAVCDSTGHGVPGAFMSLLNISYLNEAITEKDIREPDKILDHVRKRLIENVSQDGAQDGMDGILVCFEKERITYAAAQNPPVIIRNGNLEELKYDKMPVGKGERLQPFSLFEIKAEKGNVLYFYTDGYADQFGGKDGKKFKYKNLQQLLLKHCAEPLIEQKTRFGSVINDWKGSLEQVDDILIIGVRL